MIFRQIDRPELDQPAWDSLTEPVSFFHSSVWSDVWVDALAPRGTAVFLCGFDGRSLVAGLPAVITRRLGIRSFYSMPNGTYGGAVFASGIDDNARQEFRDGLAAYLRQARFDRVEIADFYGALTDWPDSPLGKSSAATHMIDLKDGVAYRPPDKKIMGHLHAGQKSGGEIVRVTDEMGLDPFYRLYRMTEGRHGRKRPRYTRRFFACLLRRMADNPALYWTAVLLDGEMIGSQINFIQGKTLFNWQTVFDYEMRQHKPNHLLLEDAIRVGMARGVGRVNLGASPPEADGLIDYKERWGGIRHEYNILSYRSLRHRLLRR